jgi:hypothetical protein
LTHWKRVCIRKGMKTLTAKLITAALMITPFYVAGAQTAKQDMKSAGQDTKAAAQDTGKGVAHAAKTTKRKTKHAVHKGASKVANKTNGQ